jgi:hypothetical protein
MQKKKMKNLLYISQQLNVIPVQPCSDTRHVLPMQRGELHLNPYNSQELLYRANMI